MLDATEAYPLLHRGTAHGNPGAARGTRRHRAPGQIAARLDGPVTRTRFVRNRCEAADMKTSTEATVTWTQALAWRMDRHLLDPVGSESVAGVVRRLGAVLSMDERLAELAIRTRRTTSRPGELETALAA